MKLRKQDWYLIGGLVFGVVLFMQRKWLTIALQAVQLFEQFRARPYWDVSRYSWGYGTQAPGLDRDNYQGPGRG